MIYIYLVFGRTIISIGLVVRPCVERGVVGLAVDRMRFMRAAVVRVRESVAVVCAYAVVCSIEEKGMRGERAPLSSFVLGCVRERARERGSESI